MKNKVIIIKNSMEAHFKKGFLIGCCFPPRKQEKPQKPLPIKQRYPNKKTKKSQSFCVVHVGLSYRVVSTSLFLLIQLYIITRQPVITPASQKDTYINEPGKQTNNTTPS
jgi:hypothetical protein